MDTNTSDPRKQDRIKG